MPMLRSFSLVACCILTGADTIANQGSAALFSHRSWARSICWNKSKDLGESTKLRNWQFFIIIILFHFCGGLPCQPGNSKMFDECCCVCFPWFHDMFSCYPSGVCWSASIQFSVSPGLRTEWIKRSGRSLVTEGPGQQRAYQWWWNQNLRCKGCGATAPCSGCSSWIQGSHRIHQPSWSFLAFLASVHKKETHEEFGFEIGLWPYASIWGVCPTQCKKSSRSLRPRRSRCQRSSWLWTLACSLCWCFFLKFSLRSQIGVSKDFLSVLPCSGTVIDKHVRVWLCQGR